MKYILACAFAVSAFPAFAAPLCGPHDAALKALHDRYGETVQTRAIQNNGTMLEMLANIITGTWTAVVTSAEGVSCSPASGTHYEIVPPGDPA